jgi:hypothetical protein
MERDCPRRALLWGLPGEGGTWREIVLEANRDIYPREECNTVVQAPCKVSAKGAYITGVANQGCFYK